MTRRNAICLLLSAGLTASCSTGVDKTANSAVITDKPVSSPVIAEKVVNTEQALAMDAKQLEQKTTAIQAMQIMSKHLRSLKKFSVHADVSYDEVLPNGQKVLLNKTVEIKADMPSKLWAKSANKYTQREFYFNGQTFTLYTANLGYYASADVPGTIGQVVIKANRKYDIDFPLIDLFLWGTAADSSADVNEAIIVGIDTVNGVDCNHFAFREKDIDWQICIQRDGTPLPLRLVITEKDIKAQPQNISVLKWDTDPDLSKQSYTFTPHSGDHQISFGKVVTDKEKE